METTHLFDYNAQIRHYGSAKLRKMKYAHLNQMFFPENVITDCALFS